MSDYAIVTDSSSNVTPDIVREYGLDEVVPFRCYTRQGEMLCYHHDEPFEGHAFYEDLRQTGPVKTSMVNIEQFTQAFEPILQAGRDILYIAMSSGISGTCAAGIQAAQALMRKYRDRVIRVVDTLAASFGEGIFALKAAEMRRAGAPLEEAYNWAEQNKRRMCQFFTVDDLNFLFKGGRISALTARIGSIANIKPLLKGDSEGKIVGCGKTIGRKKSLQAISDLFDRHVAEDPEYCVAIAHGDCEADADYLAGLLRKKRPQMRDILIRCYEPGTGSHVGPGAVALFFFSPVPVK